MTAAPKWFRIIAVIAVIWNLLGVAAYLSDVTMSPEAIAKLPPAQQAMLAARPAWFVAAYASAVWFGTAGAVGLVLRKRWARWALLASLLGLVVQDIGLFQILDLNAPKASVPIILQTSVMLIGISLVFLERMAANQGWLE